MRAMRLKIQYPKQNIGYYLPTYDLVSQIAFPRFEEVFDTLKLRYRINKNDKILEIDGAGRIIFRTMDNPARIVGYEVADSLVDELDTLKTEEARGAWNKIIARNRQKKPDGSLNTVGVATTPEGFRFVYERWKKNPAPGYRIIKAATESNAKNLPEGYIQSLRDSYPSNLLQAYLEGEFVNLTAGSVYPEFDRHLNASTERPEWEETLHIGMDFNVGKMAAIVHVLRGNDPHAVGEIMGVLDTPAMIAAIKARHPKNRIMVYPDASGNNRKSNNASESDIALLRAAGFVVCVNPANPAVKDRVLSMNAMIHKDGVRRYRINPQTCPEYVEALEKQAYDKNGEPDKTSGHDHATDAGGYCICYRYPIKPRGVAIIQTKGL